MRELGWAGCVCFVGGEFRKGGEAAGAGRVKGGAREGAVCSVGTQLYCKAAHTGLAECSSAGERGGGGLVHGSVVAVCCTW